MTSGLPRRTAIGGGDICRAFRVETADGVRFEKTLANAPADFFATEAAGLRWLAEAGAVAVPDVVTVDSDHLVLEWVDTGSPRAAAAERFGRELAVMHRAGAAAFGAAPTGAAGYVGSLPLSNTPRDDWPAFYAEQRLLPYLRRAVDSAAIDDAGARAVEAVVDRLPDLAGPTEPPARLHGDLWSGNLLWGADERAWLIDPAAHGGHRETDLAMLALFGAPHLGRILAAYDEEFPLADGWRERVPLHQLHPLLVHAALFGAAYGSRTVGVALSLR